MNKSLLRNTKMNSASNLKARLLFVLAITFVGNSRVAAGNNQNAGRKLDEIPGKYFFEFWSTNISLFFFFGACQVVVHLCMLYCTRQRVIHVLQRSLLCQLSQLIQPSSVFYSSFVLFRNCIPVIKITPLLFFVLCSFFTRALFPPITSS